MTLEDFEKELAKGKECSARRKRERSTSRDRHRRDSKRDHRRETHRSHHSREDESSHRRREKRSRHSRNEKREKSDEREEEDEWVEKVVSPGADPVNGQNTDDSKTSSLKRDTWMKAPSSLEFDYVQRPKQTEERGGRFKSSSDKRELKIHENELNLEISNSDQHTETRKSDVDYAFGDAGAAWRMTKLRAVYRQAEERQCSVDEVALERFGNLQDFDEAREEEQELDRRELYGENYERKHKPNGDLYRQRKHSEEATFVQHPSTSKGAPPETAAFNSTNQPPISAKSKTVSQTSLNKLKALMMKAKLRGDPNAADLEAQYSDAVAQFSKPHDSSTIILNPMESRLIAGGRQGEVKNVDSNRGRERSLVEENEDMSIDDMVRQERRTRGQTGGEGLLLAESISKDAKFENDLDYMDENASKIAKRVARSELNLRNMAIGDFQKMNRILDSCQLCFHEDTERPPVAPTISLATRVYLTLPTEPEVSDGGACIIPIQHRMNLLECDDDEWEEIRNFMKCLTRMYHDQGRDVIFYENAAAPQRKRHAVLQAVPLPYSLGETAPAFFCEAILTADEEWTQHKKIIDTLKKSRDGLGKLAFRRSLAKEMPYFHVWFELDGGMGHIVEDSNRWPKGDLFARETIGGMLDVEPNIVKRQGRWNSNDRRVEGFKARWKKFDWTRVLTDR